MMTSMNREEGRTVPAHNADAPGCGALLGFTAVVGGLGIYAFLTAAGTAFNAHWNSPAVNASGDVASAFTGLWITVLVFGWVMHFAAPRVLYHWTTLLTVLVLAGTVYWASGGEYRAALKAERAAQESPLPLDTK